jgi:succinyl-diaminopimelate desuccinylase
MGHVAVYPDPAQPPKLHPANVEPAPTVAVSETLACGSKAKLHPLVDPALQSMPGGVLTTSPSPSPETSTTRNWALGGGPSVPVSTLPPPSTSGPPSGPVDPSPPASGPSDASTTGEPPPSCPPGPPPPSSPLPLVLLPLHATSAPATTTEPSHVFIEAPERNSALLRLCSHARMHALHETLLWLCSIASPIGEERALCDAVERRLNDAKPAAPIRRYGDSIVVPLVRERYDESHVGPRRPHVALVGHLDTVRTENGPARIDGDRCFGAGASDMKSGLAVMIALAEELDRAQLETDLTLVFYAREEGPFAENELGPVLDRDPELAAVDLAVCMEPSDNRLHLGCNGSIHATVTFEGKTGHSARPWEGTNAVYAASPFLAEVAALQPEPHVIDGHTYKTVTTITQAKDGGRGRNVVPDRFVLNVNHRFAPDTPLETAKANVAALVKGRARVEFTDLSPAAMPNARHPLVKKLIASGVRGVEPKQAWTDVARFSARGVAAVNFGPGENAQAHQRNESTSLALVDEGYAIVRRWLNAIP